MDRELIQKLHHLYKKANLDVLKAVRTWADLEFSPGMIAEQVNNDIQRTVTAKEAEELYHLGTSMRHDYEVIAKDYEVSKGRDDLIPENIKQDKIKLSPAIRMAMDRVGANLFRHKTARTYWTMKEKLGDNGSREVYLVAVDEPDETREAADDYRPMFRKPKTKGQKQEIEKFKSQKEDLPEDVGDIKGRSPKSPEQIPDYWDDKAVSDAGKKYKTKPKEKDFSRETIRDMDLDDIDIGA